MTMKLAGQQPPGCSGTTVTPPSLIRKCQGSSLEIGFTRALPLDVRISQSKMGLIGLKINTLFISICQSFQK